MKITSDTCLFGGYIADKINFVSRLLDIGTGTGILSLMAIQKNNIWIDALEIDQAAAEQASDNFKISKWKNQLNCLNTSVQAYSQICKKKYDVIICNPPFYDQKTKSVDAKKRMAWHNITLTLVDLLFYVNILLKPTGTFFIIIPFNQLLELSRYCQEHHFAINETVFIKPDKEKPPNRVICQINSFFAKKQSEVILNYKENGKLSQMTRYLVNDYYLN